MTLRRSLIAGLFAAALAVPVSPVIASAQPGNCCCPPGQTGVIYGCASFCVDGKALDTSTGLCVPVPPPYPHPPVS
ncbi:hypothetical protein AU197_04755 [Mycobacterium sp. IS-1590]|uniref:hypothetical protein n=1 Tax=Mycobacterium sp. IS-1590 TaxID=1772286 RepID=UPI00074737AD|nr:hypothetical protein [Mycobacterium sp. IS-1590]KUI43374.1 hypothetical protein AU197_04755 [Mycobacterium sp. IS-1590]